MQGQGRRPARPTIRDVADRADVALGTVSRVLNGFSNVGADVQDRVRQAIAELGYQPNLSARSMRTQATGLVACVVPDIQNPLYAAVLGAAEATLSAAGYTLLVVSSGWQVAQELTLVEALARRRVDGVVAVPTDESDVALQTAYAALGVPIVLVEREMPMPFAGLVATDQSGSMRMATGMLLDLGHRRVALMSSPAYNRSGRERVAGYRAAHEERGVTMDPALLFDEGQVAEVVRRGAAALLSLASPPTALITAGDRSLGDVLRALRNFGRRIPDDISVISWGDGDLAELFSPPISAIRYDAGEIGREAARMLLDALRGDHATHRRLVRAELVMRQSCLPFRP